MGGSRTRIWSNFDILAALDFGNGELYLTSGNPRSPAATTESNADWALRTSMWVQLYLNVRVHNPVARPRVSATDVIMVKHSRTAVYTETQEKIL